MKDSPDELGPAERAVTAFDEMEPSIERTAAIGVCISMLIEILPTQDQRRVLDRLEMEFRRRRQ